MARIISNTAVVYPNVHIGDNVVIEENVIIGKPRFSTIRDRLEHCKASVSYESFVDDIATTNSPCVIGDYCTIRANTVIYEDVIIGDGFEGGHYLLIREGCRIGKSSYLKAFTEIMKGVVIGDNCRVAGIVADNACIHNRVSTFGTITHNYNKFYTPDMGNLRAATVLDEAIIGRGAVVIGDITIGNKAVVAAGSIVWFDVEDNYLVKMTKPEMYGR